MQVEIWADVVCPWCYIGKRRFEAALAEFPHRDAVEVVHRSFQLDPTLPRDETVPTVALLARKYGGSEQDVKGMMARVERLAAEVGLEYHLHDTLSGNSFDAHRLLHLAKQNGKQDVLLERLYRAYFTETQSLFDRESLARFATEVGLDSADVQRTLDTDAYTAGVNADVAEASALGVTGVPFFVIDRRYGVSGAQPTELFTQALTEAWNQPK